MKDLPLKQILLNHINSLDEWVSKGRLYVVAEEHGYSPESGARRLRELENESKIKVSYYDGKRGQHLARYAKIGTQETSPPKPSFHEELINGVPTMIMN